MATPPDITGPEPILTRFQAQRKLGLFALHDYVCLGLILFTWVFSAIWLIVGTPTATQLMWVAIADLFFTQCWLVVLVYRCLVFILDLQADINLMPEAAARIVLGFWEGRRK